MIAEIKIGDIVRIPVSLVDGQSCSETGVVLNWEIYDVAESFPIRLLEVYAPPYGTVKIDACYVSRI